MKNLSDKQIRAVKKLKKYKVGALFMDPGTGKSRVAYELVKSVPEVDYILWLTPFQTKQNLLTELIKIEANIYKIEIQGIESLSNSDELFLRLHNRLLSSKEPFIIVDESLKIKNYNTKRTKRIIQLGELAEYKLILNGTPLSRNLLDIWSQMEFLSRKILKMSFTEFKNTFVEYIIIKKRIGARNKTKEFIKKYHNIDYLYKLISPFVFESNLKLNSKKQYVDINYELTLNELDTHERIKSKYLDDKEMLWKRNNIFLEITQKLQHNYSLSPEKIKIVSELVKGKEKDFIIFAKYIDTQLVLQYIFPKVAIMSWQKHSYGLNLQKYNKIVFFDKVWDYALRDQAEHRVYRIGQEQNCIFYDLTGNVGLEKLINKNILKKNSLLEYFKKKSVKELQKEL